mgnify:CR=1 FL=1
MKSEDFYQQLKEQLTQVMAGSQALKPEAMVYLQSATNHLFNKLDIVSREEFEAQKAVLIRSREKITQLELQLKQLENKLAYT